MAIQIREAVRNSLDDFVKFFQLYEVKNLNFMHILCINANNTEWIVLNARKSTIIELSNTLLKQSGCVYVQCVLFYPIRRGMIMKVTTVI